MAGCVDAFGLTDTGLVREGNDDQFLIADLKKTIVVHQTSLSYDDETPLMGSSQAKVFVVADGVRAGTCSGRASLLAIQSIVQSLLNSMHWLLGFEDAREDTFLDDLRAAFAYSQQKIQLISHADSPHSQHLTTLTMAYVVWPRLYVTHSGSSSACLFRDGKLIHLTDLLTSGNEVGEAASIACDPVLSSAVQERASEHNDCGKSPKVGRFVLQLKDKLLLCTDGLTESLASLEIAECLAQNRSSEETCYGLIRLANHTGGTDNTTVVLAQFMDGSEQRARQLAEQLGMSKPEQEPSSPQERQASNSLPAESQVAPAADF